MGILLRFRSRWLYDVFLQNVDDETHGKTFAIFERKTGISK